MANWSETLCRELDEWHRAKRAATLWWRDDDAQSPSAELDRLLDLSQRHGAPLALAVIPRGMDGALASRLESESVAVLQHGFSHCNHAPPDEKKAELGDHRPAAVIHDELATGFAMLKEAFAAQFLPVLTPPWNRIAATLPAGLAQSGFVGLSTFGPRAARQPAAAAGIGVVNTHLDLIDWKGGRRFVGAHRAVEMLVAHLNGRRLGRFDRDEPSGILSHHLVHDARCWRFLGQLLAVLAEHPAARWQSAQDAFARARR